MRTVAVPRNRTIPQRARSPPLVRKCNYQESTIAAPNSYFTGIRQFKPRNDKQPSRLNVVVRKRPVNKKETESCSANVVTCRDNGVFVTEPKLRVDLTKYVEEHTFQFDHSFDAGITNEELYEVCVRPLVDAAFNVQAKCTCFAYGQTGSGKTFTMMGASVKNGQDREHPGVFLLAARDIFSLIESKSNLAVFIAFYEIYCGKLFDLRSTIDRCYMREKTRKIR